jgi:hypothetical protein
MTLTVPKSNIIQKMINIHPSIIFQYIHPTDFHQITMINNELSQQFKLYILHNGYDITTYIMYHINPTPKISQAMRIIYTINPNYINNAYKEYSSSFDGCYSDGRPLRPCRLNTFLNCS